MASCYDVEDNSIVFVEAGLIEADVWYTGFLANDQKKVHAIVNYCYGCGSI